MMRQPNNHLIRSAPALALGILAAVLASALFACSGAEDDEELLPTPIRVPATDRAGDAVIAIENAPPIKEARTVVVPRAGFYNDQSLIDRLIARDRRTEDRVFEDLQALLSFPGPQGERKAPEPAEAMIGVLRWELFAAVKRAPKRGQLRILEDIEIFCTLDAAFQALPADEQAALLQRWRKSAGQDEPARPAYKHFPLFWIRDCLPLWAQGGKNWWWAYHALAADPAFRFSREEGAVYTAPDGTLYCSRERVP